MESFLQLVPGKYGILIPCLHTLYTLHVRKGRSCSSIDPGILGTLSTREIKKLHNNEHYENLINGLSDLNLHIFQFLSQYLHIVISRWRWALTCGSRIKQVNGRDGTRDAGASFIIAFSSGTSCGGRFDLTCSRIDEVLSFVLGGKFLVFRSWKPFHLRLAFWPEILESNMDQRAWSQIRLDLVILTKYYKSLVPSL